jgi:glyoxalase family protein
MELGGLHHLTAVTGNAPANVSFYTKVLGMRLAKQTVNQDDVSAYHLFYGDEVGHPGTEVTFFDWPGIGSNVAGTGSISETGLRVGNGDSLEWWGVRLKSAGVDLGEIEQRGARRVLPFRDPEGQHLALVADRANPSFSPWARSSVPAERQIQGLSHVVLTVDRIGPTAYVLTEILKFRESGGYASPDNPAIQVAVYEVGPGGAGAEVHVAERPDRPPTRLGIGGVHHVAFRTPNDNEHRAWREQIAGTGLGVTQVIDRYYFRSIYFREPGRVLFEIATDGPGFATDEDPAHLGERLALPPFLEPHRKEIEAGLKPLWTVI